MRTKRGYRALDNATEPEGKFPEAGMHAEYDVMARARYCSCSEFWANNPDPSTYVAHWEGDPRDLMTLPQIAAWKRDSE